MEFEKVLHRRRSVRHFTQEQIPEAALCAILEAAQTAPLAMGDDRTTRITVVRDPQLLEEIRGACALVSRKTGKTVDALYGAQTLLFIAAADLSEDHIEYANAGCIIENILLQATALDLGSVYIWGCLRKLRKRPEIVARLMLPEGYEILSAVALGYPAEPLADREKTDRLAVDWL